VSDWGQESEQLFRTAKRGLSPAHGDRERVRARVAAKVGAALVGVGVAGAVVTATSKAAGASAGAGAGAGAGVGAGAGAVATKGFTLGLLAKVLAPIVLAGAGVASAPHVIARVAPRSHAMPPTPTEPATPALALPAAVIPPAALAPNAAVPAMDIAALPAAPSSHAPIRTAAPTPAASAALSADEALLVGEIDTALRGGDAAGAMRLASEHERRFPRGVLAQEREGARVVARCMTGATATSGAAAFLAAHPRSPMRARIVAACDK